MKEDSAPRVGREVYAVLFLVTLATLAYQVLLTRIFSVTLWYHFAFLAVSIAMLGTTVGAIAVFVFPERFPVGGERRSMATSALAFAVASAASIVIHLWFRVPSDGSTAANLALAATCAVIALPFTASGICVALALTRFPAQLSRLYGADLLGAACGCLAVLALLAVLAVLRSFAL